MIRGGEAARGVGARGGLGECVCGWVGGGLVMEEEIFTFI